MFKISKIPNLIEYNEKCSCWIVKRKQLTISKIKELMTKTEIIVDVSDLQWYQQINLDLVFNL